MSPKADDMGETVVSQLTSGAAGFAARLQEAMVLRGFDQSEVARRVGKRRQLVSEWALGKKVPGADNALSLADALTVSPRWLIRGVGPREITTSNQAPDDWIVLPRYDLFSFDGEAMPQPVEEVPVRRDWLITVARTVNGLWLAEMPSDAMPEIGREGSTIICRDVDLPLADGRVYAFLLDGRPIVRRIRVRPEGLVLNAGDASIEPIPLSPEQLEQLVPIGRVLAAINLQPV